MRTKVLNQEVNKEIDWSIPQWVISENGQIVFTNGKHFNNSFEGTVLPDEIDPRGEFYTDWAKSYFKPIPKEGLTIHISND